MCNAKLFLYCIQTSTEQEKDTEQEQHGEDGESRLGFQENEGHPVISVERYLTVDLVLFRSYF